MKFSREAMIMAKDFTKACLDICKTVETDRGNNNDKIPIIEI